MVSQAWWDATAVLGYLQEDSWRYNEPARACAQRVLGLWMQGAPCATYGQLYLAAYHDERALPWVEAWMACAAEAGWLEERR
jgi:hypothetical protein